MPSNKELAIKYNTSEVTIRKSIAILVNKGYLKTVERVGTFVSPKNTDNRNFIIPISPYLNVNEKITQESTESVYLSLITIDDNKKYYRAVETRKILYSDFIPVVYCIDSLIINGKYNSSKIIKYATAQSENITRMMNSFEIKKKVEITMSTPDKYIQDKLYLNENDPFLCFVLLYYTKNGLPVGKSVYYIAGDNVKLSGKTKIIE